MGKTTGMNDGGHCIDEEAISDLSSRANNPDLSERLLA
jgi:hypothetical protein